MSAGLSAGPGMLLVKKRLRRAPEGMGRRMRCPGSVSPLLLLVLR